MYDGSMSEIANPDRTEQEYLEILREPAANLLDRHLESAKEWFPHELTPWGDGRTFTPEEITAGRAGDAELAPLPKAVRSALFINLLTEDNLPYYTETIMRLSPTDHPLAEWTRRWTAEENRHAMVMRDWISITRSLDLWALERARMQQMSGGEVPHPPSITDGLVYTTLQEKATQIAHRNTGKLLDDNGSKVMARVAGDEGLHYRFYHDAATELFKEKPSDMVLAAARQIIGFTMPGTGIPGFKEHARIIEAAGIYDLNHFVSQIALPNLESWDFENLEGLTPEAETARERTLGRLKKLGRLAARMKERREERTEVEGVSG